MSFRTKSGLALGATYAIIIGMLQISSTAAGPNPLYANPVEPEMTPSLNLGKMNYEFYCSSCHGKSAGGTENGPTFISRIYHPGHHGDRAFIVAPKQGARAHHWQFGDMKPVPGVTDGQLQSILAYIRAVQKANGVF